MGSDIDAKTKSSLAPEDPMSAGTVDQIIAKDIVANDNERHEDDLENSPTKDGKKKKTASYFNVVFSGFALLSDGYQSGIISSVNLLLTAIYGKEIFTSTMSSRLSYALFVGAVIGQLGFGLIIDRLGRKIGLILTTAFVILGAALCAASSGTTATGLLWMMVISRGIMGVGVGGEYPCSSVSAIESSDEVAPGRRGGLVILVTNFVIDLGYVVSAIVIVVLLAIFKDSLEPVWRIGLGLGILPPLSVLYFRLRMADSKRYREGALRKQVPYWLIFKKYWPRVLVASGLWFVYDFVGFPMGVFSSIIIDTAAPGGSLLEVSAWNILLYAFYLPGCLTGAFVIDRFGLRRTLALGLFLQGAVGMILGGVYEPLSTNCFPMFVIMYGIFLALGEFGPGDCMGLNAMELFPTAVRGTGYGIAAAMGKVGATIGTLAFQPMQESMGVRGPFLVGSGITLAAAVVAFWCLPNGGPDFLNQQDEEFKRYLAENGYDISKLGLAPQKTYETMGNGDHMSTTSNADNKNNVESSS